jgi:hypothetical protein
MRALAGPVMLLVIVGGFGLHRALNRPEGPSRDFLELELAGPEGQPGSCYSLSTVLIANSVFNDAVREWSAAGEQAWTLSFEDLHQGPDGPVSVFQRFTFERRDGMAHLTKVQATKGINTNLSDNLRGLLEAPNERRSTPVERCALAGAQGFAFRSHDRAPRR